MSLSAYPSPRKGAYPDSVNFVLLELQQNLRSLNVSGCQDLVTAKIPSTWLDGVYWGHFGPMDRSGKFLGPQKENVVTIMSETIIGVETSGE